MVEGNEAERGVKSFLVRRATSFSGGKRLELVHRRTCVLKQSSFSALQRHLLAPGCFLSLKNPALDIGILFAYYWISYNYKYPQMSLLPGNPSSKFHLFISEEEEKSSR